MVRLLPNREVLPMLVESGRTDNWFRLNIYNRDLIIHSLTGWAGRGWAVVVGGGQG
jgi:hypothetical protein